MSEHDALTAATEAAVLRDPPNHIVDDPFGATGEAESDPYGYGEDARRNFVAGALFEYKRTHNAREPHDERIEAWDAVASHPFFRDCYLTDGTLLDAMLAKLARTQGETEWGVRIWGTTSLARSEETARAEVEFWADWEANRNPDPNATRFPRELVSRAAAGVWEVTE